jgi:hypothetical protein
MEAPRALRRLEGASGGGVWVSSLDGGIGDDLGVGGGACICSCVCGGRWQEGEDHDVRSVDLLAFGARQRQGPTGQEQDARCRANALHYTYIAAPVNGEI